MAKLFLKDKFGVRKLNRYAIYDKIHLTGVFFLVGSACVLATVAFFGTIDFAKNRWPLIKADKEKLEKELLEERTARYEDFLRTGK